MNRRRMRLALGVIVAAAALAAVPRIATNAQEPERPSARVNLRQKIADLRGEVALREVEHETDREILKQKLMRVPIVMQQVLELRSELRNASIPSLRGSLLPIVPGIEVPGLPAEEFGSMTKSFLELCRKVCSDEAAIAQLSKSLDEAAKTKDWEVARKATDKWLEGAETWVKVGIAKELAPLKKDFARHASELCLKKLEMQDLEKQYRDSR